MSAAADGRAGVTGELKIDRCLLIDGRLIDTGRKFVSINPATARVIRRAPEAGVRAAHVAVEAARHAFDTTRWATDVELRIRCPGQLHRALIDHVEDLGELSIAEVGATRRLTHGPQLEGPNEIVRSGIGREMGVSGLEESLERETFAAVVG